MIIKDTRLCITFEIPDVSNSDPPFLRGERDAYEITPFIAPVAWAHEYFWLSTAYSNPGRFRAYKWQEEPINAIAYYDTVILCFPVQVGKSMIAEIGTAWLIDNQPMNGMICYAKRDTVEAIFQERLRPMFTDVPRMRRHWSGDQDDLTKQRVRLDNCIMRVASAQVRSDIASHPAGFIYASEVCKYKQSQRQDPHKKGPPSFDIITLLRGRQESYGILGRKKAIFESSPLEQGDPLHLEMFRPGVLNLQPYYPCPTCGHYQILCLDQIKELPNEKGDTDNDPERIRRNGACRYECVHCGNDIREESRIDMGERVVWAAKTETISTDGKVLNRVKKPIENPSISFQCSRLVDFSFKFSECLAKYHEAKRGGPIKLRDFMNETMGEFYEAKYEKISTSWLRQKMAPYSMKSETIPSGVKLVLLGMDTQDNGFYFVTRGFGSHMESWLLDCDFIPCDMKDEKFMDGDAVLNEILKYVSRRNLNKPNGDNLTITMGMIDRGGHRCRHVDYCVNHMNNLYAYIGSSQKVWPGMKKTAQSNVWMGNTENLSKRVAKMADSDIWHIPEDTPNSYLDQFVNQYEETETSIDGTEKTKWMCQSKKDHYRDCENYIVGCIEILGLDETLFDEAELAKMEGTAVIPTETQKPADNQQDNYFKDIQTRWKGR
jgi:phage terminase large subunit GpA-like protein